MDILLQFFFNALMLGAIYALAAVAYTLVYGILEMINFAFGELFMFGAFLAVSFMLPQVSLFGLMVPMPGLPFLLAAPLAILIVAGMGYLIERCAYRPLRFAPRLAPLITAIAVSVALQNLAQSVWGAQELAFPSFFLLEAKPIQIGGAYISMVEIAVIVTAAVVMTALHFYVKKTRMGRAMRAAAQDVEAAALMGIPVNRVIAMAFIIGSGLAALAGIFYGAVYLFAHPHMGFMPGLKAMVAAVLGGIGNIRGAMLGGIVLGFAETFGAAYLPNGSAYRDAIAFAILILLLLFRPQGLLGTRLPNRLADRGAMAFKGSASVIDAGLAKLSAFFAGRDLVRYAAWGVLAVVAVSVFFVFPSPYWARVFVFVLIYALLASGLNIVVGFAGLLDLGFVAFWAVGSYFTSILFVEVLAKGYGVDVGSVWWLFYVNLLLGGGLAALFGMMLGYPTLRLRGDYLAIMTLGFGEIIRLVATNWVDLTRGPMGIRGIPVPSLFGYKLGSPVQLYLLGLVLLALAVFLIALMVRSYLGRAWVAIREDEAAAEAMGINTARYKLYAYSAGGFFGGVTGVFFAHSQQYISPLSFTLFENILILMLIVLGGMGTLAGPIIGAAIWVVFLEVARDMPFIQQHPELRFMALGILLVVLMIFRPQGLLGQKRQPLMMS
jgi:branched-chain amino acid transport system permease protein